MSSILSRVIIASSDRSKEQASCWCVTAIANLLRNYLKNAKGSLRLQVPYQSSVNSHELFREQPALATAHIAAISRKGCWADDILKL